MMQRSLFFYSAFLVLMGSGFISLLGGCAYSRLPRLEGVWRIDVAKTIAFVEKNGISNTVVAERMQPRFLKEVTYEFRENQWTHYAPGYPEQGFRGKFTICSQNETDVVIRMLRQEGNPYWHNKSLDELGKQLFPGSRIPGHLGFRFLGKNRAVLLSMVAMGPNKGAVKRVDGIYVKRK